MLERIIPSQTRRGILRLFFQNPLNTYYLRDIVRKTEEEVNAVKRELDILVQSKVLISERRLNKLFFTLNKSYVYYDEFMRIFAKELPLAVSLKENASRLGKIKYCALSLKYVKRHDLRSDELYLLLVGTIVAPEVAAIVTSAEQDYGKSINYTIMTEDELSYHKRSNDPFVLKFLKTPKVMLLGSEEDLVK